MAGNFKSKRGYNFGDTTSKIIAACLEVHKNLGPGFDEIFYQRAVAKELLASNLEYSREVWIDVHYKRSKLGRKRIDFVINDIMLEIKVKSDFDPGFHSNLVLFESQWVQNWIVGQFWKEEIGG